MSKINVEWVVHQAGSLPLYLTGREEKFKDTEWFKELVAKVRLRITGAHTGDWSINQTGELVVCMTDFNTIDQNFLFCEEHHMRRSVEAANSEGPASRFCRAFLDEDYDTATDVLVSWCSDSIMDLLAQVKEKAPQYYDGSWVIIAASIVAAPDATTVMVKFEQRHKSKAIPKKSALADFIAAAISTAEYWGREAKTPEAAADGAVFSMLNLLDGGTLQMPAIDLVLRPHPEDKAFHISEDEDYYVDGMCINDETMLHEEYCAVKDK